MSGSFPPKKHHRGEENLEAWLMSYADMITLLLCFFIIFISTSEPKEDKLAAATSGLKGTFGSVDLGTPFAGTLRTLEGIVESNQAYKFVSVQKLERGLEVELSANAYFYPGNAEWNPARTDMLSEIIQALKTKEFERYLINIMSYTDDTPPVSGLYANNWELSAARASKMLSFMKDLDFPTERMHIEAYGDAHPKVPNKDRSGNAIPENQEQNNKIIIRMERK